MGGIEVHAFLHSLLFVYFSPEPNHLVVCRLIPLHIRFAFLYPTESRGQKKERTKGRGTEESRLFSPKLFRADMGFPPMGLSYVLYLREIV